MPTRRPTRREAEQIVSSAQTQAATFAAAGLAEAEQELAALKAEVDAYQKRRDSIVGQLGALRDVISGFGDTPKPKGDAADDETA